MRLLKFTKVGQSGSHYSLHFLGQKWPQGYLKAQFSMQYSRLCSVLWQWSLLKELIINKNNQICPQGFLILHISLQPPSGTLLKSLGCST